MAITADVLLAVLPSASSAGRKITIANVDPTTYPTRTFSIPEEGTDLEVDASAHDWSNYFKAGLRGAYDLLKRTKGDRFRSVGMEVLVDGKVPAGGGLSSSAAFVCAASLSAVRANGIHEVAGRELVECAIVSERLVGVNSGGCVFLSCPYLQERRSLSILGDNQLTNQLLPQHGSISMRPLPPLFRKPHLIPPQSQHHSHHDSNFPSQPRIRHRIIS